MRRAPVSLVLLCSCLFLAAWLGGCSPSSDLRLAESSSELTGIFVDNSGNFGDIQVGSTSAPLMVTVYPSGAGSSYDTVTDVQKSCANFVVMPGLLPAEVSKYCSGGQLPAKTSAVNANAAPICEGGYETVEYAFPAYFMPTVAGPQSCVVTLTISGLEKTVTLVGNGLPPPREIELSRSSVAFGEVRVNNDSTAQTIVVSNTGSTPLTITSAAVSGSDKFVLSGSTASIAGNSSYTYQLTCRPTVTGAISASFQIASNDPDEGLVSVPLSCTGIDSALNVMPSPITMPPARVSEPQELMVTLQNAGTAAMNLTSVDLAGTDLVLVNAPPLGMIQPQSQVTARVRFMAKSETPVSGMLTVKFDQNKVQLVSVSAQAKLAGLSILPDGEVNLGAVCVGSAIDEEFTAVAIGGANFRISNVRASGAGFSLASASGPFDLIGGGVNRIVMRATARPTVAGVMSGNLEMDTDIPGQPRRIVRLAATAIAAGVGAAPADFDFGSMLVNEPTNVQRFALANCSGGPLTISNVTIGGKDLEDFRVVEQPAAGSIAVGSSITFPVEMRARTAGSKSATIIVTHSAGVTEIPLIGDGFLPPQPVEPIGTYYACSTSEGSAGLLLLAMGAILLLRRRRR
ncbi:MAG: choice-of-anchor D domain-containing protein [Myxococcales bacterium]|nr:choice-of-anchor D domain-containing protein [Myxococcales bacterium]